MLAFKSPGNEYREFEVAATALEGLEAPDHVVAYLRRAQAVYLLERAVNGFYADRKGADEAWEAIADAAIAEGRNVTASEHFAMAERRQVILCSFGTAVAAYRALTIQG